MSTEALAELASSAGQADADGSGREADAFGDLGARPAFCFSEEDDGSIVWLEREEGLADGLREEARLGGIFGGSGP